MIYIGCDPGKNGALAILYENGSIAVEVFNAYKYIQLLKEVANQPAIACIERVHAMPGQGVTSMFNFGHNFGIIEGIFMCLGIRYELVTPMCWKKAYGLSSDKLESIKICQQLFPDANLLATPRSRKPHDGMAESLIMADYARNHLV